VNESAASVTQRPSPALRIAMFCAITAALVRLLFLQFLHPLNWDELEFYTATRWIGEGLVPFRDFWEHHSPLMWFVFAPVTWLSDSPGVDAVVALRWAQVPVWAATFVLLNLWMRRAGLERVARWSAMTIALCSSLFMIPAVEYRVESLGCLLIVAGLVLAQGNRWFPAGVIFCLAGFTNLRLGPVLVVAVLALLVRERGRSWPLAAGGIAGLGACLSYFFATGALDELWTQVWIENLAEKYATPVAGGFVHRLLVPFGIRMLASDRLFELAAVDVGGVAVLLIGLFGLVHAFRRRGDLGLIALLQVVNIAFVAFMKFIYNYHFALVVVLMVPLMAAILEQVRRQRVMIGLLIAVWAVNGFAALMRGKELDRAYQDALMREVHARTHEGATVWSGIPWAIRREPAYRFWFLPELARILVRNGAYPGVSLREPPAAVVFDYNVLRWIATVEPQLGPQLVQQYVPVWRDLWIPGMSGRLAPGAKRAFVVPRDGSYFVYASPALATHPWFRAPLRVASYKGADAGRLTIPLPAPGSSEVVFDAKLDRLTKGQILTATNTGNSDVGVFLLQTKERALLRQPPPGVSLEAESTRVTHFPRFGAQVR
jgi:hypothetical protein